jgi:hypothetical protein
VPIVESGSEIEDLALCESNSAKEAETCFGKIRQYFEHNVNKGTCARFCSSGKFLFVKVVGRSIKQTLRTLISRQWKESDLGNVQAFTSDV